MKDRNGRRFYIALGMLAAFAVWTVLVRFVDVKAIGPQGSTVGFATINQFIHNLSGVNMSLYVITDWLGMVPLGFAMGFAVLGLIQWVQRKDVRQVDFTILVLGGFYMVVMAAYVCFEMVIFNYRPVLINGYLEASYPSSTTMLVMCVMPTAMMQFNSRIKNKTGKRCISLSIAAFIVFMVGCRLISGVHWVSDIIGGALLSAGLVMMYRFVTGLKQK